MPRRRQRDRGATGTNHADRSGALRTDGLISSCTQPIWTWPKSHRQGMIGDGGVDCHLTTRRLRTNVNGRYRVARVRHPKKDVEEALRHAEGNGWRVEVGGSHAWGKLYCPYNDAECRCGEFCITSIWSTPGKPRKLRTKDQTCRRQLYGTQKADCHARAARDRVSDGIRVHIEIQARSR